MRHPWQETQREANAAQHALYKKQRNARTVERIALFGVHKYGAQTQPESSRHPLSRVTNLQKTRFYITKTKEKGKREKSLSLFATDSQLHKPLLINISLIKLTHSPNAPKNNADQPNHYALTFERSSIAHA